MPNMTITTSSDYWISPQAIHIERNALDIPDYIQATCVSGAKILVYVKGIIEYDAGHNYQRWSLSASPTVFNTHTEKYVYVAIPRTDAIANSSGINTAQIVFPSELIDIYGKNEAEEQIGSENFYYIFLQGILTSSGDNGTVNREWQQQIVTGTLASDEAIAAGPNESEWYQYSNVDQTTTFLKDLTMKSGKMFLQLNARDTTIVTGGQMSFEQGGNVNAVANDTTPHTASDKIATPAYTEHAALSKLHNDKTDYDIELKNLRANGSIDVFGNLVAHKDAAVLGSFVVEEDTTLQGNLTVGTYNKGMQGAHVDFYGNAEFESIVARTFFEVPELRKSRTTITVGNRWQTVGAGLIESVTPYDAYTGKATLKLEKGEPGAIAVDDLCQGIFSFGIDDSTETRDDHNGNFLFQGFTTVYFKVTKLLNDDASEFEYELRAKTCHNLPLTDRDHWTNATHPALGMRFAAYANPTNKDRQASRLTTTTYQLHLAGMTDWTYTQDNIRLIIGWLNGFTLRQRVWDKDSKTYKETDKPLHGEGIATGNIYMWGNIDQFDRAPSVIAQQLYYKATTVSDASPSGILISTNHQQYNINGWQTSPILPSVENRYVWQQWLYTYSDGTYDVSTVSLHSADTTALTVRLSQSILSVAISDFYDTENPDDISFDVTAQLLAIDTPLPILSGDISDDNIHGTLSFTTSLSDDCLTITFHVTIEGFKGVDVDGVTPEDAFLTIALYSEKGCATAPFTIAQNREGEDGADGKPGEPGNPSVTLVASPDTLIVPCDENGIVLDNVGKSIDLAIYRAGDPNPYVTSGYDIEEMGCAQGVVVGSEGAIAVAKGSTMLAADDNGVRFFITLSSGDYVSATVMCIPQIKGHDGDPGYEGSMVRRTEWQEGVYYRNDADISPEDVADGRRYIDEVSLTNLATGEVKYFLATESHNGVKSSNDNRPGSGGPSAELWQPINDLRPLRTSFADIMTAFIDFLQVRQIVISDKNAEGEAVPYGAFGAATDGNPYPLWFGATTPQNAVTAFQKDGGARLANGNFSYDANGNIEMKGGKLSTYDAEGRLVSSYNENGDGTIVYYYAALEMRDEEGLPQRIKMKEDVFTYNDDGSIKGMQTRYYNTNGTLRWYINENGQAGESESYWEFFEGGEWKDENGTIAYSKIALYHHPVDDGPYHQYDNAIWDNSDNYITQSSNPPSRRSPLNSGTYTIYGKWIPSQRVLPGGLIIPYSYRNNTRITYTVAENPAVGEPKYNVVIMGYMETK